MGRSGEGAGPGPHPDRWRLGSLLGLLPAGTCKALLDELPAARPFGAGETLMIQGEPPDSGMLVILAGKVKVIGASRGGQVRVLAFRGPGDVIGELGSISGEPRVASAVAVEGGRGIWVSARDLDAFATRYPEARDAVLGTVVAKFRAATRLRIDFDSLDVLTKVAISLLDLAGDGVTVRLTQSELAELVGASVPSVQKVLERLRRPEGRLDAARRPQDPPLPVGPAPVIATARGLITILRRDALVKLAQLDRATN